jgi:hypothetical protein
LEKHSLKETLIMTRRTSTRTKDTTPAVSDLQVTPEEARIQPTLKDPINLEIEAPEVTPTPAPPATDAEKIQADIREKLSTRSLNKDVFVPSNPASLEKAAKQVAQESNFDLNRGTSIGARLLARAQKKV